MRRLTRKMEEILMDCHERQLMKQEPRSTYYIRGCKWLLQSGMIRVEPFLKEGKNLLAFFITAKGVSYLEKSMRREELDITRDPAA